MTKICLMCLLQDFIEFMCLIHIFWIIQLKNSWIHDELILSSSSSRIPVQSTVVVTPASHKGRLREKKKKVNQNLNSFWLVHRFSLRIWNSHLLTYPRSVVEGNSSNRREDFVYMMFSGQKVKKIKALRNTFTSFTGMIFSAWEVFDVLHVGVWVRELFSKQA